MIGSEHNSNFDLRESLGDKIQSLTDFQRCEILQRLAWFYPKIMGKEVDFQMSQQPNDPKTNSKGTNDTPDSDSVSLINKNQELQVLAQRRHTCSPIERLAKRMGQKNAKDLLQNSKIIHLLGERIP